MLALSAALLLAVILAVASDAAKADAIGDCNEATDPSAREAGCSIVIMSGAEGDVLATALMNRAIALAAQGLPEAALTDLEAALEAAPGSLSVLYNRGNVHLDLGQYAEAEADFGRVIEAAPEFALAWLNRGLSRERLGDRKGAERDLLKALELDPGLAGARRALARLGAEP
ncbi:MAG: tetratricopeptide repeat protein [Hyphomicrobiaceae bacterium]